MLHLAVQAKIVVNKIHNDLQMSFKFNQNFIL